MMDTCWWYLSNLKPVYQDVRDGQSVAVKTIPGDEVEQDDMDTHYKTYRDVVNHPNVERIVARPVKHWDQQWHIPMEWICGEKLHKIMFHPRGLSVQLTPDLTGRIITGLCEGLLFLHNRDITHQNIHPKNIIFDSQNHRPVIIGLFNHEGLRAVKTQRNEQYAAPETLRNPFERGEKCSDVWALGKVIYELLVGYEIPNVKTESDSIRIGLWENIYKEPVAAMVEKHPTHRATMEGVIDHIRAAEYKIQATRSLSGPSPSSLNALQPYGQDSLLSQVNERVRRDLPPGFRLPNPLPHNATLTLNYHHYDRRGRRIDITGELRTRNGGVHDVWWTVCKPNGEDSDDDDRLYLE